MRKILILCVLLAGCGTNPVPGRLDVTPALLSACDDIGADAEDIATFISAFEADRLNGFDYQTEVNLLIDACDDNPAMDGIEFECAQCSTAIIRQVYGI